MKKGTGTGAGTVCIIRLNCDNWGKGKTRAASESKPEYFLMEATHDKLPSTKVICYYKLSNQFIDNHVITVEE